MKAETNLPLQQSISKSRVSLAHDISSGNISPISLYTVALGSERSSSPAPFPSIPPLTPTGPTRPPFNNYARPHLSANKSLNFYAYSH
ncbi:hypothetical protein AYI69_g3527 [Smittium culicis]|uniref:Uncharacterized protein n=1 Tax=Smittium culicis TaxID=133412 RepID=A0A1R1YJG3_9FUNG|nr:hypothetical protein AYI69_g3527 [Smittium culicis]